MTKRTRRLRFGFLRIFFFITRWEMVMNRTGSFRLRRPKIVVKKRKKKKRLYNKIVETFEK